MKVQPRVAKPIKTRKSRQPEEAQVTGSTEAEDDGMEAMLGAFLRNSRSTAERINAVRAALDSPFGKTLRVEFGKSITSMIPLEFLVPDVYRRWRLLVRDAMRFVVMRLSTERLAPKVVAGRSPFSFGVADVP